MNRPFNVDHASDQAGPSVTARSRVSSRADRRAQGLVELAFVLPIIIVIAMAIFEFSWLYFNIAYLGFAAHEGSRHAAVGYNDNQVRTKVIQTLNGIPQDEIVIRSWRSNDNSTVTTGSGESARIEGLALTVTVYQDYRALTPLPVIMAERFNLSRIKGTATVSIESESPPP